MIAVKDKSVEQLSETEAAKELARLGSVTAKDAFRLYESYGLPYEATKELAGAKAAALTRAAAAFGSRR